MPEEIDTARAAHNARSRKHYATHKEAIKASQREKYRLNRSVILCRRSDYLATPQGKLVNRRAVDKYQASPAGAAKRKAYNQNPAYALKRNARTAVMVALRTRALVKQPCQAQGDHSGRIEAHHPDYTRPLEVVWLCTKHHGEVTRTAHGG